ncbi:hypothetical protein OO013_19390 [Mangrovivirga sp. M17]|uniref:NIPSNAP protein n=1 Tax=Mangrovivirga halotolerans TaxID=2993936 RepID=A0ABT3RXG7_9BACT|nr:hypothetical protein [Mangrovivirga halotolerans]MCX2746053.1 hypothetical protein [Mangrovivirga halotolerans]
MKKLSILFMAFAMFIQVNAQEEKKPVIKQMLLTPHPEKIMEFRKNLAEHNQKFHPKGKYDVTVYEIETGKDAGKYIWAMRTDSYDDLENSPSGADHKAHWDSKVVSTLKTHPQVALWRLQLDRSSFVKQFDHKYVRVRFFDFKEIDEAYKHFNDMQRKFSAVQNKFSIRNEGYYTSAFTYDNFHVAIVNFKEKLDRDQSWNWDAFTEKYKEMFGEELNEETSKKYEETIKEMKMELWKFDEELSTQSPTIMVVKNQK